MTPKVSTSSKRRFIPICHYCGELGQIWPRCTKSPSEKKNVLKDQVYRLAVKVNRMAKVVNSSSINNNKSVSRRRQRGSNKCLVAHCSLFIPNPDVWYFDSGCFWHISGDKDVFLSLVLSNSNEIQFGGWHKAHIARKGVAKIHGLPQLEKSLLCSWIDYKLT